MAGDDLISEQARLIARGVRAVALVGHACGEVPNEISALLGRLEVLGVPGAIPFVVERGDGFCDYGYAAAPWAVDLYRWCAGKPTHPEVVKHQHRILGLLLGYSATAIAAYENQASVA